MNLFLKSMALPLLKPPFLPSPLHKMHILTLAIVFLRTTATGVEVVVAFRGVFAVVVSGALEGVVVDTAGLALSLLSAAGAFSLFSRGFLAGVGPLEAFLAADSSSLDPSPCKIFAMVIEHAYRSHHHRTSSYPNFISVALVLALVFRRPRSWSDLFLGLFRNLCLRVVSVVLIIIGPLGNERRIGGIVQIRPVGSGGGAGLPCSSLLLGTRFQAVLENYAAIVHLLSLLHTSAVVCL